MVSRAHCLWTSPGRHPALAFANQLAAVRPSAEGERIHVWFSRWRIAEVDIRTDPERPSVTHRFAHL